MKIPAPRGKFVVGVTDIETESTLFRLFYPTSKESLGKYKEAEWIPSWKYIRGYGEFMRVPSFISLPLFGPLASLLSLPDTAQDAPLLPPNNDTPEESKSETKSTEQISNHGVGKLPVVLFSHGLGGMRTTYSQVCMEMASFGVVVAAIEHRDLSASCSLVENGEKVLEYKRLPEGEDEYKFRSGQLHQRVSEMIQLYEVLKKIDEGEKINNLILNSKFNISDLKSRLDFKKMSAVGHSFGGATAFQTAVKNPELFKCAICMDVWTFPIETPLRDEPTEIKVPLLFINTDEFHWTENITRILKFTSVANETQGNIKSQILTLKDTAHQNQSDFVFFLPSSILRKMKMMGQSDPEFSIILNNRATINFMHHQLGLDVDEKTAQDTVLDPLVEEHGLIYGISERLKKALEESSK